MAEAWELAAGMLARAAGESCPACLRPHPTVAGLLSRDDVAVFCACACCAQTWESAVSQLARERKAACEKRRHPGLRCNPKNHDGPWLPVSLDELRHAIADLEGR